MIKDALWWTSEADVKLDTIASLFTNNNIEAKDIDKIIVVDGPGSFTGIRIGISIAKVYSWSLNIPITTITSLEAMALSCEDKDIHVPIINARRGYVYTAIYDKDYNELLKPQHIKLEELQEKLETMDEYEYISNDKFDGINNIKEYNPNLEKVVNYFKDKDSVNPHAVNPEYLKLTAAEESKL
jgi:tRNA threonylcarbamoyladenosine biosynthesis protein TsaB